MRFGGNRYWLYLTRRALALSCVSLLVLAASASAATRYAVPSGGLASGACTDSSMNRIAFEGHDYAPVADFGLLRTAADAAPDAHVGLIFSGDSFYPARPELMTRMVEHGVLAVEMEASALYTLAARYGRRALAICTVSDHIVTGEETTSAEREHTFGRMVEVALTATGMALVDEVTGDLMANESQLLDVLDGAEQAQLRGLLKKLLSTFE